MTTLLTTQKTMCYSSSVLQKTGHGIGVPEHRRNSRAQHLVSGFSFAQHSAPFGGLCRGIERCVGPVSDTPTLHGLPPSIGVGGDGFTTCHTGANMADESQGASAPVEIWKPIPGFEGRYEVSDLGRVRHLPRRVRFVSKKGNEAWRTTAMLVCAPNVTREGYVIAHLQVLGQRVAPTVHALVLAAFVGPRPKDLDVNHINGVKTDNRLANLEYVTRTENHKHAVRTGLNKQALPVVASIDGAFVAQYPSMAEAARAVGLTIGSIQYAVRKGSMSKGFTWSRA